MWAKVAAGREWEETAVRSLWVRLGHSAMSAPATALPESGHGWTIYEYTPQARRSWRRLGRRPVVEHGGDQVVGDGRVDQGEGGGRCRAGLS
jgi:hypothetical protein